MSQNPFTLKEIPVDAPFCNREKELNDLISYSRSTNNVLLFSPRRYGKTSLIKRVQAKLLSEGYLTAYCDLFGVTSVEEIAGRITRAIYTIVHPQESLFKKAVNIIHSFNPVISPGADGSISISVQATQRNADIDLLDKMMAELEQFIRTVSIPIHMVFDEFQEITEVSNSLQIESVLRQHIQKIQSSFAFVGSRRRLLLDMFNDRKRPFFQSAISYELKELPEKELLSFIVSRFKISGKAIPEETVDKIYRLIGGHPYYFQKLCFFLFNIVGTKVQPDNVYESFKTLLESERVVFESIIQGLTTKQTAMLLALAREPSKKIYSSDFIARHHLGSTGGIQNSLNVLIKRDLIEKKPESETWTVVDPVFALWLRML